MPVTCARFNSRNNPRAHPRDGEIEADVPKNLPDIDPAHPEEAGARHGDATGVWRVLRNSAVLAVGALACVGLVYAVG